MDFLKHRYIHYFYIRQMKISFLLDSVRNDLGIPLDVVLFSDHANNFSVNQRVDLSTPLVNAGFKEVVRIERPNDFVLPQNGFVSFAAVYTADENAPAMASVWAIATPLSSAPL